MHMRAALCLLSIVVLTVASTVVPAAFAQEESEQAGDTVGTAAEIVFVTPKSGMEAEFEEGVKKHMAWVAEQGGKHAWYGWQVITGESTGSYYFGTFGHEWADFDDPGVDPQASAADIRKNIDPYVAHVRVFYAEMMPELSRLSGEMAGPPPMTELIHWKVKMGGSEAVGHVLKKIRQAAEESDWPGTWEVYSLRNGGHGPTLTLALPMESMSDMGPMEPSLGSIMNETFGRFETENLFDKFAKSVYSEESELLVLREDLSWEPEGEGM